MEDRMRELLKQSYKSDEVIEYIEKLEQIIGEMYDQLYIDAMQFEINLYQSEITKLKSEITNLKEQIKDLKINISYMDYPNTIGDRHEMGG